MPKISKAFLKQFFYFRSVQKRTKMFYQKFIEIDMNFSDLLRVRDSLFNMFLAFVVTNCFFVGVCAASSPIFTSRPTDRHNMYTEEE